MEVYVILRNLIETLIRFQVTVEDAIDLWINSTRVFKHYSSYFSLLHLTEIAVPEDGKVVNLDEKLRISLEQLLEEGILDSTTVVVISDGGSGNR